MESPAVVIIDLIVLIVTGCQNEAKPFSLFNATQILSVPVMGKPCCRDHRPDRPHRHPNPKSVLLSKIYQLHRKNTLDFHKHLCDYYSD